MRKPCRGPVAVDVVEQRRFVAMGGHRPDVERARDRRATHDHLARLDVRRRHPDAHPDDPVEVAQGEILTDHPVEGGEDGEHLTGGPHVRVAVDDRRVHPLAECHVGLVRLGRQDEHVADGELQFGRIGDAGDTHREGTLRHADAEASLGDGGGMGTAGHRDRVDAGVGEQPGDRTADRAGADHDVSGHGPTLATNTMRRRQGVNCSSQTWTRPRRLRVSATAPMTMIFRWPCSAS